MSIQSRQVLIGVPQPGQSLMTAASGNDRAENLGNNEGRRHRVEE